MLGIESNSSNIERFWHWLLRLGFRLLYNELAWTYGGVSWLVSLGRWKKWGQSVLPHIKGRNVLELAHGPGHLQLALNSAGYRTWGIDLSPNMSRQAHRRLRRSSYPINLVLGNAHFLPFESDFFDSVVATFPTEFIIDERTLHNIQRVLISGGRLVVVFEGRLHGGGPIYRFIEWLFQITGQRQPPGQEKSGSDIWMEIDSRLTRAGFSTELRREDREDSEVLLVIATFRDYPG